VNKVYDGTREATLASGNYALAGVVSGDDTSAQVNITRPVSGTYAQAGVGTDLDVTVQGIGLTGNRASNYVLSGDGSLTGAVGDITPKTLTISGMSAEDKVYDGDADVESYTVGDLVGVIDGDLVTLTDGGATFASKDVDMSGGVAQPQTVTLNSPTIGSTDASNYTLSGDATTTATITPRLIDIQGFAAPDKVYNGATTVDTSAASFDWGQLDSGDYVGSETLTLDTSGSSAIFDSKNVNYDANGNIIDRTVTASGYALADGSSGGLATNYELVSTSVNTNAKITRKEVDITGLTVLEKTYDGTGNVDTTLGGFSYGQVDSGDLVPGETLELDTTNATVAFDDEDVSGDESAVGVTATGYALADASGATSTSGGLAANYKLANTTKTTSAIIRRKVLDWSPAVEAKTYDGTAQGTIDEGASTLDPAIGNDVVGIDISNVTATFSGGGNVVLDTNGNAQPVGITIGYSSGDANTAVTTNGPDANNYSVKVTNTGSLSEVISPLSVAYVYGSVNGSGEVTNENLATRYYDGTDSATLDSTKELIDGVLAGDSGNVALSGSRTATYASADVAYDASDNVARQEVTIAGIALGGTAADNYVIGATSTARGIIAPRPLTLTGVTTSDKAYDRTAVANVGNSGSLAYAGSGGDAGSFSSALATGDAVTAEIGGINYLSGDGVGADEVAYNGVSVIAKDIKAVNVALTDTSGGSADANYRLVDATATGITPDLMADSSSSGAATVITDEYVYQDSSKILPRQLDYAVAPTVADKVYDGTASGDLVDASGAVTTVIADELMTVSGDTGPNAVAGIFAEDLDSITVNVGNVAFDDADVNRNASGDAVSRTVNITGVSLGAGSGGDKTGNYTLVSNATTSSATITPYSLDWTPVVDNKVYDGSDVGAVNSGSSSLSALPTAASGDSVDVDYTAVGANFASANVARDAAGAVIAQPYTISSLSLTDTDAGNYSVGVDAGATLEATITPKTLSYVPVAVDKIYDGESTAGIESVANGSSTLTGEVSGEVGGDVRWDSADFGASGSATDVAFSGGSVIAQPVVFDGLRIISSGTLNPDNYQLSVTAPSAKITPRTLTTDFNVADKAYDGTADATITTTAPLANVVTISGTDDDVSIDTSAGNAPQANFLADSGGLAGSSDPEDVRFYIDDNGTPSNPVDDVFTLVDKTIEVSNIQLSGADAHNYVINPSQQTTAQITRRQLIWSPAVKDKIFDGNTNGTLTDAVYNNPQGTLALANGAGGVLVDASGDFVEDFKVDVANVTATFDSENVAYSGGSVDDQAVSLSDIALTGTQIDNYVLASTATAQAKITPRTATLNINPVDKIYDGTTDASLDINGATLSNVVSGDGIGFDLDGANFAQKDVGNGVGISLNNPVLVDGNDQGLASNYTLAQNLGTGAITRRPLTITASASDKIYDGSGTASITGYSLDNLVGSETLGVTESAANFVDASGGADANVGVNKTVRVDGLSLADGASGGLASNYKLVRYDVSGGLTTMVNDITTTETTATISPRSLSFAIDPADKVYDGEDAADLQVVSGGATISVSAGDAEEITLDNEILQVSGSGPDSGLVAGEDLRFSWNAPTFESEDVAYSGGAVTAQTVTVSGISAADNDSGAGLAANYTFANSATGMASITRKPVDVNVVVRDKVYDGNSDANVISGSVTGIVGENDPSREVEDLTITWTGAEYMSGGGVPADHVAYDASGDVALKDVQLTNFTLQDGNVGIAANYQVNITLGQARILPKVLQLDGRAPGKVYDGTSEASVSSYGLSGFVNGERVSIDDSNAEIHYVTRENQTVDGESVVVEERTKKSGSDYLVRADNIKLKDGPTSDDVASNYTLPDVNDAGEFTTLIDKAPRPVARAFGLFSAFSTFSARSFLETTPEITPATLTVDITAEDQVYDGDRQADVTVIVDGDVEGDDLIIDPAAVFDTKDVGIDKPITLKGAEVGGADAVNYETIVNASTTASVTPLDSVTWTGNGDTNNWFDARNWGTDTNGDDPGGFVAPIPDGNNVTNVVLPEDVEVDFDPSTTTTAPAERDDFVGQVSTGAIEVDSLTGVNGSSPQINMSGGTLKVGSAVTLESYRQTGGQFETVSGDVTITEQFDQNDRGGLTDGGKLITSGAVDITDLSAGAGVTTISASGDLTIDSQGGGITQTGKGAITVGGDTQVNASQASGSTVDWANEANDFGLLSLTGYDATLVDRDDLTLGPVSLGGSLDVSVGAAGSEIGGIKQTDALEVSGSTTFAADTKAGQSAQLTDEENQFVGPLAFVQRDGGTWADVDFWNNRSTVFGETNIDGDIWVRSLDGIGQIDRITVGGKVDISSTEGRISLDYRLTDFGELVAFSDIDRLRPDEVNNRKTTAGNPDIETPTQSVPEASDLSVANLAGPETVEERPGDNYITQRLSDDETRTLFVDGGIRVTQFDRGVTVDTGLRNNGRMEQARLAVDLGDDRGVMILSASESNGRLSVTAAEGISASTASSSDLPEANTVTERIAGFSLSDSSGNRMNAQVSMDESGITIRPEDPAAADFIRAMPEMAVALSIAELRRRLDLSLADIRSVRIASDVDSTLASATGDVEL
jgi:predicted RNA-binding protein with TRAM domain